MLTNRFPFTLFCLTGFLFHFSFGMLAQVPQGISWQAVIRDPTGAVLSNHSLGVRISLLQGGPSAVAAYSETHQITTNALGLVSLTVGTGAVVSGNFNLIPWTQGPFFTKVELDLPNTGIYTEFGTQQLMSVPYALVAGKTTQADTAQFAHTLAPGQVQGQMMYWNGTAWTMVAPGQNGQGLVFCDGIPTWGFCPYWPIAGEITLLNLNVPTTILAASASVPTGGSSLLSRGICLNNTGNPTLQDVIFTGPAGTGSFTITLTGLVANTTYHARSYASNGHGTSYGPGFTFTTPNWVCGTSTLSDYDGNVYNTVQIGSQCWMKENLATTHYADGTALVDGTGAGYLYGGSPKYWFVYGDLPENKNLFGLLYSFSAVLNNSGPSATNPSGVQGVCPVGWHVPSDTEWKQLESYLGMSPDQNNGIGMRGTEEGGKIKSQNYWASPNVGATNSSGFSALPGGFRSFTGYSVGLGTSSYWWTSSDSSNSNPWTRFVLNTNGQIGRNAVTYYEPNGYSIRCLKNINPQTTYAPVLTTAEISSIGSYTSVSGGFINSDGGVPISGRGVCWNTTGNPTLIDSHTSDGIGGGVYSSSLSGLYPGTTYFVRAYATNSIGTAYGNEVQFTTLTMTQPAFTCGTSTISDFDGNVYNTVQIGQQCWMKENLATTHYADGSSLIDGTNAGDITGNYTTKYWFVYDNQLSNKTTYGLLYTWAGATNGVSGSYNFEVQGACPNGWSIPRDAGWQQMVTFLGGISVAGGKLKETGTTHWISPNGGATNTSGFTALPGGYRQGGSFSSLGSGAGFLTGQENSGSPAVAYFWSLNYFGASMYHFSPTKDYGYSVRCVKNN